MGYRLGIDLGMATTVAAVERDQGVEVIRLGVSTAAVPTLLYVEDDGTVHVGEAAEQLGEAEPSRLVKDVKRRVGSVAPVTAGELDWPVPVLLAGVLWWVTGRVSELEGGPPDEIVLSHPARWVPHQVDGLRQAVEIAELAANGCEVRFITEPEAAAAAHAARESTAAGTTVVVYDLGARALDVTAVRQTHDGFEILGESQYVEGVGGAGFDAALLRSVLGELDRRSGDVDLRSAELQPVLARLRSDGIAAKEKLSSATDAPVSVLIDDERIDIGISRRDFERVIAPRLRETLPLVTRASIDIAGGLGGVDAIVLAGGSARIPYVAELLAEELHRPVVVDDPGHVVAVGAASAPPSATRHVELRGRDASPGGDRQGWMAVARGSQGTQARAGDDSGLDVDIRFGVRAFASRNALPGVSSSATSQRAVGRITRAVLAVFVALALVAIVWALTRLDTPETTVTVPGVDEQGMPVDLPDAGPPPADAV